MNEMKNFLKGFIVSFVIILSTSLLIMWVSGGSIYDDIPRLTTYRNPQVDYSLLTATYTMKQGVVMLQLSIVLGIVIGFVYSIFNIKDESRIYYDHFFGKGRK